MRAGQEEGDVVVIPRGHRPSQEALRAAEGTIARYGIRDSTSISDMVNDRALKSGGILTVVAVLWWLTVYRQGDQFSSQSIFFGLGFVSVSWLTPLLVFVASVSNSVGRTRGTIGPSLIAGLSFALSMFYMVEPLIRATFDADLEVGMAMIQTLILLALGGGTYGSSRFLLDAMNLRWLKMFFDQGFELDPIEDAPNMDSEVAS